MKQRKVLAISTFRDVLGHWVERSASIVDYVIPAAPAEPKPKKEKASKAKTPTKPELSAALEEMRKIENPEIRAILEKLQLGAFAEVKAA